MNRLAFALTIKCFETKDIYLDLGMCGLTDQDLMTGSPLDRALRKCIHLEHLVLSNYWNEWDEKAKRLERQISSNGFSENYFTTHPPALEDLINLKTLICCGAGNIPWQITDMSFVQKFSKLVRLDLSSNKIEKLTSLDALTCLQKFYISDNQITELQNIQALIALQVFIISSNRITELEGLKLLTILKVLDASRNQITELKGLTTLAALKVFDASRNQITELKDLDNLTSLQSLNISYNNISELKGLDNLTNLQSLNISYNYISELKELDTLNALRSFNISQNKIEELKGLDAFTSLQTFNIAHNQIAELKNLNTLKSLRSFNISYNQISELKGLKALTALRSFNIAYNQITELKGIDNFTALQSFDISRNLVTELKELDHLTALQTFNIASNKITDITPLLNIYLLRKAFPLHIVVKYSFDTQPGDINVDGNPLSIPPMEIAMQGNEAVLNYFEEIEKQGASFLYEAKMLIVGQPRAGKTSLRTKLFDINAPLPEEDKTTKGIDIERLCFTILDPEEKPRTFYYNVWDFGGQQIYQATHQFFLTNRSLYVLVIDTGKDSLGNDDSTVNYWLQAVELLGKRSPLILVRNEKNLRRVNIDLAQKRARFGFLKKDYDVDLNALIPSTRNYDIKQVKQFKNLKADIETELGRLELVGFPMPKNWVQIRNDLRLLSELKPYISRQDYIELCEKYSVNEFDQQMELSSIFHDLGIFLHFQDYPILEDIIILQNTWATDAVFAVLDNEKVKAAKGSFSEEDVPEIWKSKNYKKEVHKRLLALMMQFELCYRIETEKIPVYIVPELLDNMPPADYAWDPNNNITILYRYDFMPKGLLTRLIVRLNQHIQVFNGRQSVWKTGVKIDGNSLSCPYTTGEIKEEWDSKNMSVRVKGNFARELMTIISFEIDTLNKNYFKEINTEDQTPRSKWYKMIPCNCKACQDNTDKNSYDYNELLERKNFGKDTIECNRKPYYTVQISELIEGTFARQESKQQFSSIKKKANIFISSSSKDRDIRNLLITGLMAHLANRDSFHFHLWSDKEIDLGSDWKEEIDKALGQSSAAILLISAGFAASVFIQTNEFSEFLKKKKETGYLIMPILIRDYNFSEFETLSSLNFFKTYFSEYGFNKPIERNKLLPFDVLADNSNTTEEQLNKYYRKLADFIDNAVKNHSFNDEVQDCVKSIINI